MATNFKISDNGITCLCENAKVGEKGFINGIEYEAVDNLLLRQRLKEKTDLSKLCTSLVTDLSSDSDEGLFERKVTQKIESWDVSNVLNMKWLFINTEIDQSLDKWNVKNVTNMQGMFQNSSFNKPISNWNVKNVTNMNEMFFGSLFNQDISKWCVTNINSEPFFFSHNAQLSSENKPKWGTCPK